MSGAADDEVRVGSEFGVHVERCELSWQLWTARGFEYAESKEHENGMAEKSRTANTKNATTAAAIDHLRPGAGANRLHRTNTG